jgi:transmembrane sensor
MTGMRGTETDIPQKIADEAAGWMIALQEEQGDRLCRDRFENWLDQAEQHRQAWARLQVAWQALGSTAPVFKESWKDAAHASAHPKSYRPRRAALARRAGMLAAAAAAMLCLAFIVGPTVMLRMEADYRTQTAERRTVTLEDGSLVHLSGASAIATDFKNGRRSVRLLAGEAFFEVTPDKSRPFIVDANGVAVTVLGTKFDVQTDGELTVIALAEGSVKASVTKDAAEEFLVPGDQLMANSATGEVSRVSIPVSEIATWRDGKIFVVDATIGSVVEQIRRYHPAWISLPDGTLASRRVTGFYDLRNPDQALQALVAPYGGKVRRVSPAARLISRF